MKAEESKFITVDSRIGFSFLFVILSVVLLGSVEAELPNLDNVRTSSSGSGITVIQNQTTVYIINGTSYNSTYDATSRDVTANRSAWFSTYNVSYNGLINNASYLSTYNVSYNGLINNASYLSTYNLTYQNKAGTGNCPAGQFPQNTTISGVQCATPAGGSSFNSTYNTLLNQNCPSGVVNGTYANGTLICTEVSGSSGNSTFNQSLTDSLYWNLNGNTGTTDSNFIGTADDMNVTFKRGGNDYIKFLKTGIIMGLGSLNGFEPNGAYMGGGLILNSYDSHIKSQNGADDTGTIIGADQGRLGAYTINIDGADYTGITMEDIILGGYSNVISADRWNSILGTTSGIIAGYSSKSVMIGGERITMLAIDRDTSMSSLGGKDIYIYDSPEGGTVGGNYNMLKNSSQSFIIGGNNNRIEGISFPTFGGTSFNSVILAGQGNYMLNSTHSVQSGAGNSMTDGNVNSMSGSANSITASQGNLMSGGSNTINGGSNHIEGGLYNQILAGNNNFNQGQSNVNYGTQCSLLGTSSTATSNCVDGFSSGYSNTVNSSQGTALGYSNMVNGQGAIAGGSGSKADGYSSISLGNGCNAFSQASVCLSYGNVYGTSSFGLNGNTYADYSYALDGDVYGQLSSNIGDNSGIYADNSHSIGENNKVGYSAEYAPIIPGDVTFILNSNGNFTDRFFAGNYLYILPISPENKAPVRATISSVVYDEGADKTNVTISSSFDSTTGYGQIADVSLASGTYILGSSITSIARDTYNVGKNFNSNETNSVNLGINNIGLKVNETAVDSPLPINSAGYSTSGVQGITDSSSYWLCTASDCSSRCQVQITGGLITNCI